MVLDENGYHDVPAGKLAAITTSLEMLARPALRPEVRAPGRLRRVAQPDVAWYRDLSPDRRGVAVVFPPAHGT